MVSLALGLFLAVSACRSADECAAEGECSEGYVCDTVKMRCYRPSQAGDGAVSDAGEQDGEPLDATPDSGFVADASPDAGRDGSTDTGTTDGSVRDASDVGPVDATDSGSVDTLPDSGADTGVIEPDAEILDADPSDLEIIDLGFFDAAPTPDV